MMNKEISDKESATMARALYLDGAYVEKRVIAKVITAAKHSGLLATNVTSGDKRYCWVLNVIQHYLMIDRLLEQAKENPYNPKSMDCLNNYSQIRVSKAIKAITSLLNEKYPPLI